MIRTVIIVVMVIFIFAMLLFQAKQRIDRAEAECRWRGGVFFHTRSGDLCLDPKALR